MPPAAFACALWHTRMTASWRRPFPFAPDDLPMRACLRLRDLLGFIALLAACSIHAAADPARWQAAIDAFVAADRLHPPPPGSVLFTGSSSIVKWCTLEADFPGVPVLNRGFGGSTVAEVTAYADRVVLPYRPRLIVFYAGDNDIAEGHTPQRVATDVAAFVARVRRELPGVPIVYISIKPSPARWSLWPAMQEANRLIAAWAGGHDVRFVDVTKAMLGAKGRPRAELFGADGLHMNSAGYALWSARLRPVIAALSAAPQAASGVPAASASK